MLPARQSAAHSGSCTRAVGAVIVLLQAYSSPGPGRQPQACIFARVCILRGCTTLPFKCHSSHSTAHSLGPLFCVGPQRSSITSYSCLPLKMMGKKWICPSGLVWVSCAWRSGGVWQILGLWGMWVVGWKYYITAASSSTCTETAKHQGHHQQHSTCTAGCKVVSAVLLPSISMPRPCSHQPHARSSSASQRLPPSCSCTPASPIPVHSWLIRCYCQRSCLLPLHPPTHLDYVVSSTPCLLPPPASLLPSP